MNDLNKRNTLFKSLTFLMVTAFVVAVTGCGGGGGGSSSGGGGGSFAGTYSGTGSATISAPGVPSGVVSFSFTVTIDQNGAVTYMDDAGATLQGTLSGNTFSLSPRASNLFGEPSCSGTVTFAATINGVNLIGTIDGNNVVCFGVPNGVTGSFNGTLSSPAASLRTPSSSTGPGWEEVLKN